MADYGEILRGKNPWGIPEGPWEPGRVKAIGTEPAWNRARLQLDIALLQLKAAWGYTKLGRELENAKAKLDAYMAAQGAAPKAFDPNQPRVPAGNPNGGEWTRIGSPSGIFSQFFAADETRPAGTRVAGRSGSGGRPGPRRNPSRAAPEVFRDAREAEANRAIERVRKIDPGWWPSPTENRRNSIQAQAERAEEIIRKAEARLSQLQLQPIPETMRHFRESYGTNLLGHPIVGDQDIVATGVVDGEIFMGLNSGALVNYSDRDLGDAIRIRLPLVKKHPKIMQSGNVGQKPNDALFHAESTVLLRAARANGGTLEGKTMEVTVDREMCPSCKKVLPLLGLELGNPTVIFRSMDGRVLRIMRDGAWKE
ncbi:MAG: hypothetical protein AAF405_07215 [Pseudomonadota bacterium]